jgi:hypothetical protein
MTKAATDKSSANDFSTLSKQKLLAAQALMATLDENIRRDATRTGSYRLRRNRHLYDTEASQATRDITSGGTHHHPWHEWRSDATCKGHRKKMRITVQYLDDLAPVDKSDVLVVPMRAYDSVRGLPWFHKQS